MLNADNAPQRGPYSRRDVLRLCPNLGSSPGSAKPARRYPQPSEWMAHPIFMPKLMFLVAVVAGLACHSTISTSASPAEWVRANPAAPTYELRNGRWLAGESFE